MGFVKSPGELTPEKSGTWEFFDAEMLTVFWETKPEIVRDLLPPPLQLTGRPVTTAFFARYPETNFGPAYIEGALFLRAAFKGREGNYCLAMHVTDDMAMALGREVYGFPKKMAKIGY